MSETESQMMDSEDDASTSSTDGSKSPITIYNETGNEEEENDAWMLMVEKSNAKTSEEMKMNLIHSGRDKQSAGEKAYSSVLPNSKRSQKISIWNATCG